jgi:hypothetical protein
MSALRTAVTVAILLSSHSSCDPPGLVAVDPQQQNQLGVAVLVVAVAAAGRNSRILRPPSRPLCSPLHLFPPKLLLNVRGVTMRDAPIVLLLTMGLTMGSSSTLWGFNTVLFYYYFSLNKQVYYITMNV